MVVKEQTVVIPQFALFQLQQEGSEPASFVKFTLGADALSQVWGVCGHVFIDAYACLSL
jgi:hypothetical protein